MTSTLRHDAYARGILNDHKNKQVMPCEAGYCGLLLYAHQKIRTTQNVLALQIAFQLATGGAPRRAKSRQSHRWN